MRHFFTPRRVLCAVVPLILAISLVLTESMTLDKSLAPLIPDTSPELARVAALLDLAPFSRVLAVQLDAGEAAAARLPEFADQIRAKLDPNLMAAPSFDEQMPNLEKVMGLLPALCDDATLARVAEAAREDGLRGRLEQLKRDMAGADAFVSGLFWRLDPLNLRVGVFRRFPRLTGLPQPDPLLGYPVSADGKKLLLLIRPKVSMSDTEACVELMDNLEAALTSTLPAGVTAQIAGGHRHTAANAGAITRDLFLTLSLAMLLILAIYIFLIRSWGALWLFVTPAAAVLVATAILAVVFPKVSGLALGFGAAVLGIAEDYAVHMHFALRHSPDRRTAVKHVAKPLLMSVLLCAGGFGVLLWSGVEAVRQLSVFTILSIVIGYLWAMLVLPYCPGMNLPREVSADTGRQRLRRPRKIATLAAAAALAAVCLALFAAIPKNESLRSLGFVSPELQRDQAAIEKTWNLNRDLRVFLVEGENADSALALAGQVETAMRGNSPELETATLAGLWPTPERQEANLRRWNAFLSQHRDSFVQAFASAAEAEGFAPEAFTPFLRWFLAEPRKIDAAWLADAGLGALTENFLAEKNGRTYAVLMAQGRASGDIRMDAADADRITELSAARLERGLGQALARDRQLIPIAAAICFLVLIWAYKDVFFAVLAFIPALAGVAGVLAWLALSGRSLGLVEAAGLPLVVCLGADYGILVVNEFCESLDLGAVRAVLVAGLTTVAGIGILVLARHPVLHVLGGTVFVGLLAAMPVSIVLLPKFCLERTRDGAES